MPCLYQDIAFLLEGYAQVKKEGMWGFVNEEGVEVIPCAYPCRYLDKGLGDNYENIENEELRERILTLIE